MNFFSEIESPWAQFSKEKKDAFLGLPNPFLATEENKQQARGSSNNVNLQRSRYGRLKWDIDKLKYEKLSKYRFTQPKCLVLGTPNEPEKGNH